MVVSSSSNQRLVRPSSPPTVVSDPKASSSLQMMKAVENEGMPTFKNPMIQGNLFLILNIEFPESLQSETQDELRKLLPPPLNSTCTTEDDDVEVHTLSDIDPVQSDVTRRQLAVLAKLACILN